MTHNTISASCEAITSQVLCCQLVAGAKSVRLQYPMQTVSVQHYNIVSHQLSTIGPARTSYLQAWVEHNRVQQLYSAWSE